MKQKQCKDARGGSLDLSLQEDGGWTGEARLQPEGHVMSLWMRRSVRISSVTFCEGTGRKNCSWDILGLAFCIDGNAQ